MARRLARAVSLIQGPAGPADKERRRAAAIARALDTAQQENKRLRARKVRRARPVTGNCSLLRVWVVCVCVGGGGPCA